NVNYNGGISISQIFVSFFQNNSIQKFINNKELV
ncbi:unnamed protein product, partial [marine sediment metagenome]